jgi:hypothetical protein
MGVLTAGTFGWEIVLVGDLGVSHCWHLLVGDCFGGRFGGSHGQAA